MAGCLHPCRYTSGLYVGRWCLLVVVRCCRVGVGVLVLVRCGRADVYPLPPVVCAGSVPMPAACMPVGVVLLVLVSASVPAACVSVGLCWCPMVGVLVVVGCCRVGVGAGSAVCLCPMACVLVVLLVLHPCRCASRLCLSVWCGCWFCCLSVCIRADGGRADVYPLPPVCRCGGVAGGVPMPAACMSVAAGSTVCLCPMVAVLMVGVLVVVRCGRSLGGLFYFTK